MHAILALIQARDRKTREVVEIRVSSAAGGIYAGVGGQFWEPAITRRLKGSITFASVDMQRGVRTATADFVISLASIRTVDVSRLVWSGARITIWNGDRLSLADADIILRGQVARPALDLPTNALTLNLEVSARDFDTPLLTKLYSGSGGINGDPGKRGALKPAGYGPCFNVEPFWIDEVRNIGQLDGYQNTLAITTLFEALVSFGPAIADYDTYEDLAEAIDDQDVKPGQWATCIAEGLIGLGAPPDGVITCHVVFGFDRPGALMKHVITEHAGIDPAYVLGDTFDLLDAAVAGQVGYWTGSQRSVQDLVVAMAASCNATPVVTLRSEIAIVRMLGGELLGTLDRFGYSDPSVTDWQTDDVIDPVWRLKARTARPARVMTYEEIRYEDDTEDLGTFNPLRTYRQGNRVWLLDSSHWLYVNTTPAAGHVPPYAAMPDINGDVSDAWWFRLKPPTTAADVLYGDGTSIEDLKPVESGADITKHVEFSASSIVVRGDYAGVANDGELPRVVRARRKKGGIDLSPYTDWSIDIKGNATATINNDVDSLDRGVITITGVTNDATITVISLVDGVTFNDPLDIDFQAVGPPPQDAIQVTSFAKGTTYPAPTVYGPVEIAAGQGLNFKLHGRFSSSSGVVNYFAMFAYRPTGTTTWTYLTEIVGFGASPGEPDSINGAESVLGLAAGSYDVSIVTRCTSANASTLSGYCIINGFIPARIDDISGVAENWDARSGVTTVTSAVSAWAGSHGNSLAQATAARRPAYSATAWDGTLPALTFDGAATNGDVLTRTGGPFLNDTWVFIVAERGTQQDGATDDRRILLRTARSSGGAPGLIKVQRPTADGGVGKVIASGGLVAAVGAQVTGWTDGKALLWSELKDAIRVNLNGGVPGTGGAFSGGTSTVFYLGGVDAGVTSFAGKFAQVVIVDPAGLDDADRQKIEGILAWDWGLLALLPTTHPYKKVRP